ncbi:hypothetical protein PIB30_081516 [Stylosanthes scabra]|uniref:Uncharacterized protein n=1 Tax=Stylosanthes scabra TaxID=79078 RepID=A0ABU6XRS4_9FABA|nr:hypothetical protein [Stylosanthes scabra]
MHRNRYNLGYDSESERTLLRTLLRFRPTLWLPRRSCAESAAFEDSRLNLGSTPAHLGGPVQWVNQPMVHLVNRSTRLDQSMPVNHRSTSDSSQEVKRLYTDFANSDYRKFCGPIYKQLRRIY